MNLIFSLIIEQICLIYTGHTDEEVSKASFAALGLALFTINTFCLSFGMGVLGATDTLASQAFGNNDLKEVSVVFRKSQVVLTIMFIIQSVLMIFLGKDFLVLIGLDETLSGMA